MQRLTLFHPKTERRLMWISRGVALIVFACVVRYITTHDYSRPDMLPRFVGCYRGSGPFAGVNAEITPSSVLRSEGLSTKVKIYPGKSDGPYIAPEGHVGFQLTSRPHLTIKSKTVTYIGFNPQITEFRIRDPEYSYEPVFTKAPC